MNIPQELITTLKLAHKENKHFTFLIGAGLSAESGIPTFRGKDGYWIIGSKNYHPQEMATKKMFNQNFEEVWKWYLSRIVAYHDSTPNSGHYALVHFENLLGNFSLVSQNVDGLNLRAGSSVQNFYPIHGDLTFMRCVRECTKDLYYIPEDIKNKPKNSAITPENLQSLICPSCGSKTRPHVLWFDEYYNEDFYKFNSVQNIALKTNVLVSVGTTGATNLPNQIFATALHNGALMIDINIEENPFSNSLKNYKNGYFLKGKSGKILPLLYKAISE